MPREHPQPGVAAGEDDRALRKSDSGPVRNFVHAASKPPSAAGRWIQRQWRDHRTAESASPTA